MFTASPSRKSFVPEYPDITVYIEALEQRIQGQVLERVRFNSPFLLRSLEPPVSAVEGKQVISLRRIGKRIAIGVEGGVWLVIHLMIAGRLHWRKLGALCVAIRSSGSAMRTMKPTIALHARLRGSCWLIDRFHDF